MITKDCCPPLCLRRLVSFFFNKVDTLKSTLLKKRLFVDSLYLWQIDK